MVKVLDNISYCLTFMNETLYLVLNTGKLLLKACPRVCGTLCYIIPSIYNTGCTGLHTHINSSTIAPLNATQIAVMKVSHLGMTVIGPE